MQEIIQSLYDKTGRLSLEVLKSDPINSIKHAGAWATVSGGLKLLNMSLTSGLLFNSASLNPKNINIDSSNQNNYGNPIDKIKNTNPYQDFTKSAIEDAKNGVMTTSGSIGFETYDNKDLYYSMHLVNITTNVEKGKDAWAINSQISDKYDFNKTNPSTYKGSVVRAPATQAYKDQSKGYLSNFTTTINISDQIQYEKK